MYFFSDQVLIYRFTLSTLHVGRFVNERTTLPGEENFRISVKRYTVKFCCMLVYCITRYLNGSLRWCTTEKDWSYVVGFFVINFLSYREWFIISYSERLYRYTSGLLVLPGVLLILHVFHPPLHHACPSSLDPLIQFLAFILSTSKFVRICQSSYNPIPYKSWEKTRRAQPSPGPCISFLCGNDSSFGRRWLEEEAC